MWKHSPDNSSSLQRRTNWGNVSFNGRPHCHSLPPSAASATAKAPSSQLQLQLQLPRSVSMSQLQLCIWFWLLADPLGVSTTSHCHWRFLGILRLATATATPRQEGKCSATLWLRLWRGLWLWAEGSPRTAHCCSARCCLFAE